MRHFLTETRPAKSIKELFEDAVRAAEIPHRKSSSKITQPISARAITHKTVTRKTVEEWTLSDVGEILNAIRSAHGINEKNTYQWCADRLIDKYGDKELIVLHHHFVVFPEETKRLIEYMRHARAVRNDLQRIKDRGLYGIISSYDGEHDTLP